MVDKALFGRETGRYLDIVKDLIHHLKRQGLVQLKLNRWTSPYEF